MTDPSRIRPLKHRIVVSVSRLSPSIGWFPGFVEPPPYYHPLEMPQFVRKRLIDFLEARYPVPPTYLQHILTTDEAGDARRLYRQALADGSTPGEAILHLGLISRKRGYNLPTHCIARVLRAGCDCLKEDPDAPAPEILTIASSAGEPLDDRYRVIRCADALGRVEPCVELDRAERAADAARLLAFRSRGARLVHTA